MLTSYVSGNLAPIFPMKIGSATVLVGPWRFSCRAATRWRAPRAQSGGWGPMLLFCVPLAFRTGFLCAALPWGIVLVLYGLVN